MCNKAGSVLELQTRVGCGGGSPVITACRRPRQKHFEYRASMGNLWTSVASWHRYWDPISRNNNLKKCSRRLRYCFFLLSHLSVWYRGALGDWWRTKDSSLQGRERDLFHSLNSSFKTSLKKLGIDLPGSGSSSKQEALASFPSTTWKGWQ